MSSLYLDGWTWADAGEIGPFFSFNKQVCRLHYIAMNDGVIVAAFATMEGAVDYAKWKSGL